MADRSEEVTCSHGGCPAPDGRCWRERMLDALQADFPSMSRDEASKALIDTAARLRSDG